MPDELFINEIGDTLMLTPRQALRDTLRQGAAMVSDDFMADGRPEEIPAVREGLQNMLDANAAIVGCYE